MPIKQNFSSRANAVTASPASVSPFKLFLWIAMAAILGTGAMYLLNTEQAPPAPVIEPAASAARQSAERSAPPALPSAHSSSPFGRASAAPDDPAQRRAARKARMEAGGYSTPAKYFAMELPELRRLAQAGDVFALVQLAEQYSSEWAALQDQAGFDSQASPKVLSEQLFTEAMQGGFTQLAPVMAVKAIETDDLVAAYAWNLVSEKLRNSNAALDRQRARFSSLSDTQKNEAIRKSEEMLQRLRFAIR